MGTAVGSETVGIYFEAVVHHGAAGFTRHYVFKTTGGVNDPWPATGTYEVRIDDVATGKVVASLDGTDWDSWTHNEWKTRKLDNYQIGTELFHSVDEHPGEAADHCTVSDAKIRVAGAWTATAFTALTISDFDKNGTKINPASSHEWIHQGLSATGWEMWDQWLEH